MNYQFQLIQDAASRVKTLVKAVEYNRGCSEEAVLIRELEEAVDDHMRLCEEAGLSSKFGYLGGEFKGNL